MSAAKIGIFFGTDTGRTRLIAKQIAKKLEAQFPGLAVAPINISRTTLADFLAYDALILGSSTLGEGELPGLSVGPINQLALTEERLNSWLTQIRPDLLPGI